MGSCRDARAGTGHGARPPVLHQGSLADEAQTGAQPTACTAAGQDGSVFAPCDQH